MIINVANYIKGYLVVEVKGFSIERFMNLAVNKNIYLWDVIYLKDKIQFKVSIKGYKLLKECGKKTRCRIKIIDKKGYPFFMFKYRRRKILFGGIGFFLVILYVMSLFIWSINVIGVEDVEVYKIIEYLNKENIKGGTLRSKIKSNELEEKLIEEFDNLSWVNVQKKGTTLHISCSEVLEEKKIEENNNSTKIIANKNGVITEVFVKTGTALLKPGDVFKVGDILISGEVLIDEDSGKTKRVQPKGKVRGRVDYDVEFLIKNEYVSTEPTGKKEIVRSILLGENKVKIGISRNKFENYDIISESKRLSFGENYDTPIVYLKETYVEVEALMKKRTEEESKIYGKKLINTTITEKFEENQEVEVENIDIKFENKKEGLIVRAKITVTENIGIEIEEIEVIEE